MFFHTPVALTVEKKGLLIGLPYLANLSLALKHAYRIVLTKIFLCKIKVIFNSTTRLSNFFRFRDKMPFNLRSTVVYKFACGRCNATSYGEICRHLNVRVGQHSGVSLLTGKSRNLK